MVPRQRRETLEPDWPRFAYCIATGTELTTQVRRLITPAESSGFRGVRFRGGTFIAYRSQFHRTGRLALLAPMPLGTEQPLSRSAIVANENFFSHAKEVLRGPAPLAKRCFRQGRKAEL